MNIFTVLQQNILYPIFLLQSLLKDEVSSNLFEDEEEAQNIIHDGIDEFEEDALFFIDNEIDFDEDTIDIQY